MGHGKNALQNIATETTKHSVDKMTSKLQDVAEQIHSQFHARKHLQKKMVVDVKRMGKTEIREAIEEQAGMTG